MQSKIKSAVALASTAAALFALGGAMGVSTAFAADAMSVKCVGVNSCKGTSDCKTAKSECKGLNSCKGMGWVSKSSAQECTSAGGTISK